MSAIFDTHAHYDDLRFREDREEVLGSLASFQVKKVVNIAADVQSIETTAALAKACPFVYGALGIHPDGVPEMSETTLCRIRELVEEDRTSGQPGKLVAIGEIGLDYHDPEGTPREEQKTWFLKQLSLARELDLPVVIHSRDAAKDTYDLLKTWGAREGAGIIHCFSYSREMAKSFLELGYYIGIGGVVTFKNAHTIQEVAQYVPSDRLLLETDCPYLAPVPHRGERNFSGYLPEVVRALATLRNESEEQVIEETWANAHRLYRIKESV